MMPTTITLTTVSPMLRLADPRSGRRLAEQPLDAADFLPVTTEFWRDQYLRAGQPAVAFEDLSFEVHPGRETSDGRLETFVVEGRRPAEAGRAHRQTFTARALVERAEEAARELVAAGRLAAGSSFVYDVALPAPFEIPPLRAPGDDAPAAAGLPHVVYPLARLKAQAALRGAAPGAEAGGFPVFYAADALARAERFSRAGWQHAPPIETGAVLLGFLCACPSSGEFFVLVSEALQLQAAEATKFQLAYSMETWARIRAHLDRRRASGIQAIGQCHGHNFVPGTHTCVCERCQRRELCNLTTAFLSEEDRLFMRSVFPFLPLQVAHVFGLDARGARHEGVYTLRDGRLQPQGYYQITQLPEDFPNTIASTPTL